MITINCSTKEEADKVIEAFDTASSVLDGKPNVPYSDIIMTVSGDYCDEWDKFVKGHEYLDSLIGKE